MRGKRAPCVGLESWETHLSALSALSPPPLSHIFHAAPAPAYRLPITAFMPYSVKEIFYTLQGEGANAGRAAVFLRFSGCNLWTGREQDRARAVCQFCDTDFVGTDGTGGGHFPTPLALAAAVAAEWPEAEVGRGKPFVVCTGGEPLLQLDPELIAALHAAGFEILG